MGSDYIQYRNGKNTKYVLNEGYLYDTITTLQQGGGEIYQIGENIIVDMPKSKSDKDQGDQYIFSPVEEI